MNAPRRRRGFTLLEVMVALSILATGLVAISQLTGAALRNHSRAVRMEVATLLARGKLASLQDVFDKQGFRDFDDADEGSFEEEGHPEVRWKLEVLKPRVELGTDKLLGLLLGAQGEDGVDLASLLGSKADEGAEESGIETLFPSAGLTLAGLQPQLVTIGEQLKSGLREIRLTVSWTDGGRSESFTVVTHLVSFPKGGAR